MLRPQHGAQLVRVGHRSGEVFALPDGMVPGADFYVVGATPTELVEFIEIKSVSGEPPFLVSVTRAEYLRAVRCAGAGIRYRLILVDVGTGQCFEASGFAADVITLQLGEALQFVIWIRESAT